MAYTDADLAVVRSAIASGIQRVRFADGREVHYQNLDQLLAAERVISAQLTLAAQASQGLRRRKFASHRDGFG